LLTAMDIERDELRFVFKFIDKDASGDVDYEEFSNMMHQMRTRDSKTTLAFLKLSVMELRDEMQDNFDKLRDQIVEQIAVSVGGKDRAQQQPRPPPVVPQNPEATMVPKSNLEAFVAPLVNRPPVTQQVTEVFGGGGIEPSWRQATLTEPQAGCSLPGAFASLQSHGSPGLDELAATRAAWTKEQVQSEFRALLEALQQVLQETLVDINPAARPGGAHPIASFSASPPSSPAPLAPFSKDDDQLHHSHYGATPPGRNADPQRNGNSLGYETSQWRVPRSDDEPYDRSRI